MLLSVNTRDVTAGMSSASLYSAASTPADVKKRAIQRIAGMDCRRNAVDLKALIIRQVLPRNVAIKCVGVLNSCSTQNAYFVAAFTTPTSQPARGWFWPIAGFFQPPNANIRTSAKARSGLALAANAVEGIALAYDLRANRIAAAIAVFVCPAIDVQLLLEVTGLTVTAVEVS